MVLVASAGQSRQDIFSQSPVIGIVTQGLVTLVQGAVAILEPPQVNKLVLLSNKDVEVAYTKASQV